MGVRFTWETMVGLLGRWNTGLSFKKKIGNYGPEFLQNAQMHGELSELGLQVGRLKSFHSQNPQ